MQELRPCMLVQSTRLFPLGKPWFPKGKQSRSTPLHGEKIFVFVNFLLRLGEEERDLFKM